MSKDLQRLLSKSIPSGDCILFTGAGDPYGVFWFNGKNDLAHRVSYLLQKGPIRSGLQVCHTCDTPKCINPAHLFLGTIGINAVDRVRKGRNRKQDGELQEQAKLTNDQAREIRQKYKTGKYKQAQLAREYGISPTSVHDLLHNRTYREERICNT